MSGEFSKGLYVCYNVHQINRRDIQSGEMIVPVENRICLSDLEEMDVGSFWNLTWNSACWWGENTVRDEKINSERDIPDQDSYFLPSLNGAFQT